jgi:hypothetical protein
VLGHMMTNISSHLLETKRFVLCRFYFVYEYQMTCIKETSLIEWKSNYGWTDGQTWEKLNGLDTNISSHLLETKRFVLCRFYFCLSMLVKNVEHFKM